MYYSYKVFGSARGNLTPPIMWRDVTSTAPVCPLASTLRWNAEPADLQKKLTVWLPNRGSSVSTVARYGLNYRGSTPQHEQIILITESRLTTRLTSLAFTEYRKIFHGWRCDLGVKLNAFTLVKALLMLKQAPRLKGIWRSGGLAPWIRNTATRWVVS